MTILVDQKLAVELLERAVAEKGADYIYFPPGSSGTCLYDNGDTPGCIVGHALSYLGVSNPDLGRLDDAPDNSDEISSSGILPLSNTRVLEAITGVTLTPEAEEVWAIAQRYQDDKVSWGLAVSHAKARARANGLS